MKENYEKESQESTQENQSSEPAPLKRRRGRPKMTDEQKATAAYTREQNKVDGVPNEITKPRGRPPKKRVDSTENKIALAKQLCGIHLIAAHASGIPELAISDPESESLADAIISVSKEYGLALDGKTGAAIQLAATAAMIYAPRYIAIKNRAAQKSKQEKPTENVEAAVH